MHLTTLSDAEKDLDACIGGTHEAECAKAVKDIELVKTSLRQRIAGPTIGDQFSPRPRVSTPLRGQTGSPSTPVSTPLRERVASRNVAPTEPDEQSGSDDVPTRGLSLYGQRRLRNEDLLNLSEVRARTPSGGDASAIVPPPDSSPMPGRPAMSSTKRPGAVVLPGPVGPKRESQPQELPSLAPEPPVAAAAQAPAAELLEGLRSVMRLLKTELKMDQVRSPAVVLMRTHSHSPLNIAPTHSHSPLKVAPTHSHSPSNVAPTHSRTRHPTSHPVRALKWLTQARDFYVSMCTGLRC
jgi:hypothetical protein